jgi:outer membrane protein TolC
MRTRRLLPLLLATTCLARGAAQAGEGEDGAVALTLAEALQSSDDADEQIGRAELELEVIRASTAAALSALLPTPGVGLSRIESGDEMMFLRAGLGYPLATYKVWRPTLEVSAPLLAPSAIGSLVAAGRAEKAEVRSLEATRHQVLYGVVRSYYLALSAHSAVEVSQASADSALTLEAAAESRLAAGTETRVGVERARADRITANGAVEQARFTAEQADLGLAYAAHLPLASYTLSVPGRPTMPGTSTADRVEQARDDRPDIQSAAWTAAAAAAAAHAAGLGLSPELRLGFSWQYTIYDRQDLRDELPAERWSLGLQLEWALPGTIGPAADVRGARASQRQAQLEQARLEREIDALVRSAELALEAAEANLQVTFEIDVLAQANLDAGLRLYQEGLATGLEVTTLKTERDAAAAELVGARLARDLAEVDLVEALGLEPLTVYGAKPR